MKIKHSIIGLSAFSLIALSSCFDNDYDLGDIDTTVKVRANLTVPIQLDNITLDQVLDIDDDSEIVKTKIAGENGGDSLYIYAVKKMGTFKSDPIEIDQFITSDPDIQPTHSTLNLTPITDAVDKLPGTIQDKLGNGLTAYYDITTDSVTFDTSAEGLDEALKDIEKIGVETSFGITLVITDEDGKPLERLREAIYLEDVRLKLPNALIVTAPGGEREEGTDGNVLYFKRLEFDAKGNVEIGLTVEGIDTKADGVVIDYDKHTFDYSDHIKILQGHATIYKLGLDLLPEHVAFTFAPRLSGIKVTSFTGEIEYKVADFSISPVDLSGLPDILTQSGTKLWLHNPQIYLSANNPVWEYDAYFATNFSFTSIRDGQEATYNATLSTERKDGKQTKINNFILSPSDVDPTPDAELEKEFPDWRPIPFDGLRNMLAGDDSQPLDGIPDSIEIHAADPMLPQQRIEDFKMGVTLDAVNGSYAFFAPLQLSDESHIKYEDTIDGWSDDDLDNVTIQKLYVSFNASTEIPFDVQLNIYPIDKNGKDIEVEKNQTVHLSANADNELVEVLIEGTIRQFDGIRLEARVVNKDSNTILAPTMQISIKNSKASIEGYYQDEL